MQIVMVCSLQAYHTTGILGSVINKINLRGLIRIKWVLTIIIKYAIKLMAGWVGAVPVPPLDKCSRRGISLIQPL